MKCMKRIFGFIGLILWAATVGLVGMILFLPIFLFLGPDVADKWINMIARPADIFSLWLTDGRESMTGR